MLYFYRRIVLYFTDSTELKITIFFRAVTMNSMKEYWAVKRKTGRSYFLTSPMMNDAINPYICGIMACFNTVICLIMACLPFSPFIDKTLVMYLCGRKLFVNTAPMYVHSFPRVLYYRIFPVCISNGLTPPFKRLKSCWLLLFYKYSSETIPCKQHISANQSRFFLIQLFYCW